MSLDDDPSDFDGVLPVIPIDSPPIYKDGTSNAATGASAAGARAFAAQAVAFYFRAPVKAFFRTRVDYLVHIPCAAIIVKIERENISLTPTTSYPGVRQIYTPTYTERRLFLATHDARSSGSRDPQLWLAFHP